MENLDKNFDSFHSNVQKQINLINERIENRVKKLEEAKDHQLKLIKSHSNKNMSDQSSKHEELVKAIAEQKVRKGWNWFRNTLK